MDGYGFSNEDNLSNWEFARLLVHEGEFNEAHKRFLAEIDYNDSFDALVYDDHGHLLNRMGRYDDAIVKFDSYLSSHPDYVSSLFGKGISYMGLNSLDEAISYFDKVLEFDNRHADAWYYSAIILGNPFYHNYDCSLAKERYEKYQNLKEDYINNPIYFDESFDDLTLEEVHKYYNVSDFFRLIEQLLERGNIAEFDYFFNDYCRLSCLNEDDRKEQFNIFRLFEDASSLVSKIEGFNRRKNIECRFESAGFDDNLICDLSSRLGGLSVEDKGMLVELMDYFKGSRLSLDDINDLIRKNVLVEEMSFDSFNEIREDIVKRCIEENNDEIVKPIKKDYDADMKYFKNESVKSSKKIESLYEEKESLSKKIEGLNQIIQNQKVNDKKQSIRSNIDKSDESMGESQSLIDKYYNDLLLINNKLLEKAKSCLEDNKEVSFNNNVFGIHNENYMADLDDLKDKYGIKEDVLELVKTVYILFDKKDFSGAYEFLGYHKDLMHEFNRVGLKEYWDLLRVTLLSCDDKIEDAYNRIKQIRKMKEKSEDKKDDGEFPKEEIYPIGWLNLGNICFSYAILQSNGSTKKAVEDSKKILKNAYEYYDLARKDFGNRKGKFNFNEGSEEKFINHIKLMNSRKNLYTNLIQLKLSQSDFEKEFKKINGLQQEIKKDLSKLENSEKK